MNNIDWSNVEVDTKVLVSDDGKKWHKRYFARVKDNVIYTWQRGQTSFSVPTMERCCMTPWNYCELYEE